MPMKKKISLSTAVTLLILTAALTISITMLVAMRYFNHQVHSVSQRQTMYEHINDVDKKVREYYEDIDEESLRQAITKGYATGLKDPYAAYYTPDEYNKELLRLDGKANNVGLDVCLNALGNPVVCKVYSDSAASKAGVRVGDVLTAIDTVSVDGKSVSELQNTMDTAAKVLLSVQRDGATLAFDLSAYEYTVRSVLDTMLDGDVGYVQVTAFYNNTPEQFRSTVSDLLNKGAVGLIFDLRNNRGGSSEAVQEVISYLMPLGMYGSLTDHTGVVTKLSASANNQISVSTVTLVNERTAGEAEFFAGVLQEASLTTVVGKTTAGKAKYQQLFPLELDHSALRLTVGEYGLLKGGSWQDVGIVPSVEIALSDTQAAIYRLLAPKEDVQVQVALQQIVNSDANALKNAQNDTAEEK